MKVINYYLLSLLLINFLVLLQELRCGGKSFCALATRHQPFSALATMDAAASSPGHMSYELKVVPNRIMRSLPRHRPPTPKINIPTHYRGSMPHPPLVGGPPPPFLPLPPPSLAPPPSFLPPAPPP